MKIRNTNATRKVWIQYHNFIPKDINGVSYEIHHIDGNNKNDNIENLIALPIDLHYQIHYLQGDYSACNLIAERLNKPNLSGYKLPPRSEEHKLNMSIAKKGIILSNEWKQKIGRSMIGKNKLPKSEEHKKNISLAKTGVPNEKLKNRIFKEETIQKMSNAKIGKKYSTETNKKKGRSEEQLGEKNPMFGKIWITDGVENKTIKKYEIIPQNWHRGQTKKQKIK